MPRIKPTARARFGRVLFTVLLAVPALGASDCSGLTGASESDLDGTYDLYSVTAGGTTTNVSSSTPFYMYGKAGDANSLRLISGRWVISGSGTALNTTMTTIARYSGKDDPAFAERHTGTIEAGETTATATLDTGTKIYGTLGSDEITYSSGSATLRFRR
ncbi:MAG: hypothetical protein ABIR92_05895 [Gemmatimonadaceae bacterium]